MSYSNKTATKTSKFLSFVLRHQPDAIQLELNSEGWASIAELIDKAQPQISLTLDLIEHVVAENDKQRFAISTDGLFIRANQGHSIQVDLRLTPQEPPALLYHGTATRFIGSIAEQGLKAGQRQHVHLSRDKTTATAVGQRYGKHVILEIDAATMHQNGATFYLSENGVWLTENVPTRFIRNLASER